MDNAVESTINCLIEGQKDIMEKSRDLNNNVIIVDSLVETL